MIKSRLAAQFYAVALISDAELELEYAAEIRRIADLDDIEPPPGWEDRAVERARAASLLDRQPATVRDA